MFPDPASASSAVGDTVTVAIKVGASGNQPVDAAQAYLDFNPALLRVVDAAGDLATSINPGAIITSEAWQDVIINHADNNTGRVEFAAGRGIGGTDALSEFELANIHFKIICPTSGTALTFDTAPPSVDGNPETKAAFEGDNVTGAVTNGALDSATGSWNISHNCAITGSLAAPANVTVESGNALTINPNASLDIDFATSHLLIKDGAKVVIKDGGKVE